MTYFKPKKGRVPAIHPSPEWTDGDVRRVLVVPVSPEEVDDPDSEPGPESSADELERLAQEHEDEEYRYRESQGEERRGK